jgi:serine protease AprX
MKLKNLLLTSVLILNYTIQAQTDEQRAGIKKDINMSELNLLKSKFQAQFEMDEAKVVTYLAANPLVKRTETKNGSVYHIKSIDENGKPVYINTKSNIESGQLIKANSLYSGGSIGADITGTGMVAGVWDGGQVRATHELLTGKATMQASQTVNDANGGNDHMTHVTGTIVGKELPSSNTNANARGIAYNATAKCYDWSNDITEMAAFAADGFLISNHSYGFGNAPTQAQWTFGAYDNTARSWDALLKTTPNYLPFVAAGNEQSSNGSGKTGTLQGYDVITGSSAAKNVVTVGSVGRPGLFGDFGIANQRDMSDYSNFGPTDDGRIKPDICARGTRINSSFATADTAYSEIQGTSMAAPAAAAAALLLQQYYYSLNNSYMSAAMLKCLLLHSADDAGTPGPDARFGWGILNIETAAQIIKDDKTTGKARMHTFTTNPSLGSEVSITGNGTTSTTPGLAGGTTPIKASICWTDDEGTEQTAANGVDPTTSRLVYNFDLSLRRYGANNVQTQNRTYKALSMANPTAEVVTGAGLWENNVDTFKQTFIAADNVTTSGAQYILWARKSLTSPTAVKNVAAIITGLAQTTALSTDDFESNAKYVFYSQTDNKLKLISNEINVLGNFKVYDINGKLIQKGQSNSNEIELNFDSKGVFVAVFENDTWKQSLKFIK